MAEQRRLHFRERQPPAVTFIKVPAYLVQVLPQKDMGGEGVENIVIGLTSIVTASRESFFGLLLVNSIRYWKEVFDVLYMLTNGPILPVSLEKTRHNFQKTLLDQRE